METVTCTKPVKIKNLHKAFVFICNMIFTKLLRTLIQYIKFRGFNKF